MGSGCTNDGGFEAPARELNDRASPFSVLLLALLEAVHLMICCLACFEDAHNFTDEQKAFRLEPSPPTPINQKPSTHTIMRTMYGGSVVTLVSLSTVTTNAFMIPLSISKPATRTALQVLQEPPKNGVRVPRQTPDFTDEMLEDMSRQMKDMNEQLQEWSNLYPRDPTTSSNNKPSYVFAGKKDYKVQPWYNAPEDTVDSKSTTAMNLPASTPAEEDEKTKISTTTTDAAGVVSDGEMDAIESVETALDEDPTSENETIEPPVPELHNAEEVYFQEDIPLNDEFVTGKTFKVENRRAFRRPPVEEEEIPADIVTPPSWNTDQVTRATNLRLAERLKDANSIIKGLTAENAELKAIQSQHDVEIAKIQAKLVLQEETIAREREAANAELEIVRQEGTQALETAKAEAQEMLMKSTKELEAKLDAAEALVGKLEFAMKQANQNFVCIEEPPEPSPSVVPQDGFPTPAATEHPAVGHVGVRENLKKTLGVVKGAVGAVLPFKRGKSTTEEVVKMHNQAPTDMGLEDGEEEPKLEA